MSARPCRRGAAAPPDLPPWEVPAPHRDKLDELVENAKQLDNFRIK